MTYRLLAALTLLLSLHAALSGQTILEQKVEASLSGGEPVLTTLLASEGQVTNAHQGALHYAEQYQLSMNELQRVVSSPNRLITIVLTYKGVKYKLQLVPNHFKTADYAVRTEEGQTYASPSNRYYHGTIAGKSGWCTLAVMGSEVRLVVAHADGNIEVVKQGDHYIAYESSDLKLPKSYSCGVKDDEINIKEGQPGGSRQIADCLELYVETDHRSYTDNNSSVAQTEAWVMSIVNDVSTIYSTVDIPLSVSGIFVRTTSGPYASANDKTTMRNTFVNNLQDNYEGRVALLFSTRNLEGGLAYGIGGYCADYPTFPGPFAVATSLSTNTIPYPSYSFNVQVVAHELGHVLGARHTHACVWNGNDTQIDDCGNVWATDNGFTAEGATCYDENSPILPISGTIMSYCDLLTGVGIDLSNGFGSEVGSLLSSNFQNAICSTGGVCSVVPPSNDDCQAAIPIPNRPHCVYTRSDNVLGTLSSPTSVSCGTLANASDVWFSFVAVGSVARITIDPLFPAPSMLAAAYTGSCGALTEVGCRGSQQGNLIILEAGGLSSGETVYVRVIGNFGAEGSFDICVTDASSTCHPDEQALLDLYNGTNGDQWNNNDGWASTIDGSNCDVCRWYGITCDQSNNIIEIDLSFNNLVGQIPASVGSITTLRKFDVFSNTLSGTMPNIWGGTLALEYLDLSANSFTGLIPRSIMNLPLLETVYLENNLLQDTLPRELGLLPSIDVLWLKNNQLTGCFPGTFVNICDISSKSFTGNVGLPGGGDFITYCLDGTGNDADFDGYCKGMQATDDCDDEDAAIYPGAPEVCDGKDNDCDGDTDEQLTSANTWLGGSDSWLNATRWSTGGVPRACEDVVINSGVVTLPAGGQGFARSVTISGGSLSVNDSLWVSGSEQYGIAVNAGAILTNSSFVNIENVELVGIQVDGSFSNTGVIFVENKSTSAEIVIGSGVFSNTGGTIDVR